MYPGVWDVHCNESQLVKVPELISYLVECGQIRRKVETICYFPGDLFSACIVSIKVLVIKEILQEVWVRWFCRVQLLLWGWCMAQIGILKMSQVRQCKQQVRQCKQQVRQCKQQPYSFSADVTSRQRSVVSKYAESAALLLDRSFWAINSWKFILPDKAYWYRDPRGMNHWQNIDGLFGDLSQLVEIYLRWCWSA